MDDTQKNSNAPRGNSKMWIVALVATVLVIAGIVIAAVAGYRTWVAPQPAAPSPPPPSEKIENAPGPDNTIKTMPANGAVSPATPTSPPGAGK